MSTQRVGNASNRPRDNDVGPSMKVTKKDLLPKKNRSHKMGGIDAFLSTVYDEYALEYGEYFQESLREFESKLERLSNAIQQKHDKEAAKNNFLRQANEDLNDDRVRHEHLRLKKQKSSSSRNKLASIKSEI